MASPIDSSRTQSLLDQLRSRPDAATFKYVNLVLQGGGTLGIAHVGAIAALEAAGYRFAGIAGASAGAIVAVLLASARSSWNDSVADTLSALIADTPMASFVDGPSANRKLVKKWLARKSMLSVDNALGLVGLLRSIRNKRGINSGDSFTDWLSSTLDAEFDVKSTQHLKTIYESGMPEELEYLCQRSDSQITLESGLRITTTALPAGLKLVFPEDLVLLPKSSHEVSPSVIARMSMSVPLFFEPYRLRVDRSAWRDRIEAELGQFLDQASIERLASDPTIQCIDGGVLSNFPIDSFASPGKSEGLDSLNSIGLRLQSASEDRYAFQKRSSSKSFTRLIDETTNLMEVLRRSRDLETFHLINKIGKANASVININLPGINWLDFTMKPRLQEQLCFSGASSVANWIYESDKAV